MRRDGQVKMLKSYVAFDIETTGLSPEHNEIIEIGALKVREGKVVDRFIRFIEPEAGIPPMITQLTGITNDMVEGAGTAAKYCRSSLNSANRIR